MSQRLVPYKYNSYTDVLLAAGTAHLAGTLFNFDDREVRLKTTPSGIEIRHPEPRNRTESVPFQQIRDKESREVDENRPLKWDKTRIDDAEQNPHWWTTVSVINTLARPDFNNRFAKLYTPELGEALLNGTADFNTRSRSQLLYAQASKGVNQSGFNSIATSQGNINADEEQMLALLGYQVAGIGYIKGNYTITIVPRPKSISLQAYRRLVRFLRGYTPRATSGKPLPTREQTVPFFLAMAYFDFIIELFDYQGEQDDYGLNLTPGEIVAGLDRVQYFSMGTSSAPYSMDTLAIPQWLDEKDVGVDVRNLIREMLGQHTDPKLLYLPVRAFAESDPRPLVEFYREYEPMRSPSSNRKSKRLIRSTTLSYIMTKTGYKDLDCEAMQNFAQAIRSRTLSKLYHDEQPDYDLLTRLRSASRNPDRLVSTLSDFLGKYNLHNARQSAIEKNPDGKNLRYEDLQEIRTLIAKYDAEFVANTLMAQAMTKRGKSAAVDAPTDDRVNADV